MVKKVSTGKKLKKRWFPILSPPVFGNKIIGESLLSDSSALKGRYITMNLSNILNDPRKHSTNIQFKIKDVKNGQGITEITKYELITSYTKRLIRRGRNKIEDSFILKAGDNKRIRVKIIAITNNYAFKSTATRIRAAIKEAMKIELAKSTFEKVLEELLRGGLQKEVKKTISKISPIRNFEIRVFKLARSRKEKEEGYEEVEEIQVEEVKEKKAEAKEELKEKKAPEEKT
ncbi:MAG: hypothetical protein ABIB43_06680, partial [archaeon]